MSLWIWYILMGMMETHMDDQENIKEILKYSNRDKEWEQIRREMEAGSSDVIPKNNYFEFRFKWF